MTYEWKRHSFKWQGRCDICGGWTTSGVRGGGRIRFRHLCEQCARNRFAGEIVAGLGEVKEVERGDV